MVDEKFYCVGTVVTNRKGFPKYDKAQSNAKCGHLDRQVLIGKLHDCVTHYGTRPFMVSHKIKLHRNYYKRALSGYILPYISIKFCMVTAKSSGYIEVKTDHKSQQLNWTCGD